MKNIQLIFCVETNKQTDTDFTYIDSNSAAYTPCLRKVFLCVPLEISYIKEQKIVYIISNFDIILQKYKK